MASRFRASITIATALTFFALSSAVQAAGGVQLEFIGQSTFPTGYTFNNIEVGGLSVIDYDPATQSYVAISDDRGENGLSELLAYRRNRFIALERSFSTDVGNGIKLFLTTPRGATNVRWLPSIRGRRVRPMRKLLLLDPGRLGITLDNVEGISFGPRIDGDRRLILVSDNNFSPGQLTQLLVFRMRRFQ